MDPIAQGIPNSRFSLSFIKVSDSFGYFYSHALVRSKFEFKSLDLVLSLLHACLLRSKSNFLYLKYRSKVEVSLFVSSFI